MNKLHLSSDLLLITAQKCVLEMYGILKTTILTEQLASYGCKYSSSGKPKNEGKKDTSILTNILDGDEFRNKFWHRHVLEAWVRLEDKPENDDEHTRKLRQLVEWRACYERVRTDVDAFLKRENIIYSTYNMIFSNWEWQLKLEDLSIETLIPGEDAEVVISAWHDKADIFLTKDKKLVSFSFSLPLEPNIPAFCLPNKLEQTIAEKLEGFQTYPDECDN